MLFDSLPAPVRDSLYVAVGWPVVAGQEAAARRQELAAELDRRLVPVRQRTAVLSRRLTDLAPRLAPASLAELNLRIDERVKGVEDRVVELEGRIDHVLDRFEGQLPEPAREVVHKTRDAARDARTQLRTLVSRAA
jgi:hypothetical protein